jgi:pyruvate dehydrogenase E1 component beta subunit
VSKLSTLGEWIFHPYHTRIRYTSRIRENIIPFNLYLLNRSLRPLDRNAIVNSVKKTNRLVTVEEGWPQCGIGAEIAAIVMESEAFDYLDAPVERVTGADVPMPYAQPLEKLALPQLDDIVNVVKRTVSRKL